MAVRPWQYFALKKTDASHGASLAVIKQLTVGRGRRHASKLESGILLVYSAWQRCAGICYIYAKTAGVSIPRAFPEHMRD